MTDLLKFFEVAIDLRNSYTMGDDPYKNTKVKILTKVVDTVFYNGKVSDTIEIQYPMPVNSSLLVATVEELFSALSIDMKLVRNSEKIISGGSYYCAVFSKSTA